MSQSQRDSQRSKGAQEEKEEEERDGGRIIRDSVLLKPLVAYWKSMRRPSSALSAIGPRSSFLVGQYANSGGSARVKQRACSWPPAHLHCTCLAASVSMCVAGAGHIGTCP